MPGPSWRWAASEALEERWSATRAGALPVAEQLAQQDDAVMRGHGEGRPGRVWIELDLRSESIAGALHGANDTVRPFHGWLELVAVLEAARRRRTDDPAPPPPEDMP